MPSLQIIIDPTRFVPVKFPSKLNFLLIQDAQGIISIKDQNHTPTDLLVVNSFHTWPEKQEKNLLEFKGTIAETITVFFGLNETVKNEMGGSPQLPKVLQVQGPYLKDTNFTDDAFRPVMGGMAQDTDTGVPTLEIARSFKTYQGFGSGIEGHVQQN